MKYIKEVVLAALFAAPVAGLAQDAGAAEAETGVKWERNVGLGATFRDGNTRKSLFTMNLKGDRFSDDFDLINSLYAEYGKTGTPTTSKEQTEGQVRGQSEYRFKFGDSKMFAGAYVVGLHDAIKRIRFRGKLGPSIGYYFIDEDDMKLDATFGLNYVYERTASNERTYGEYRAALNYLWKITDRASYYLNLEYNANMEEVDTDNSGLLVTGVRSQVFESLSMFVELRDEYDNLPDSGVAEHNDITVLAGLSYDF